MLPTFPLWNMLPSFSFSRGRRGHGQAAEVDARMLGALLAGVRRALPYLGAGDAGDAAVGRHADALFRMLHVAPFGVRAQALALLAQLLAERGAMSDRFYRCAPLRGRTRPCLTAPSSSSAVGQQLGRQRD